MPMNVIRMIFVNISGKQSEIGFFSFNLEGKTTDSRLENIIDFHSHVSVMRM